MQVLPLIQKHGCFALKGGTAMNLFVQDMPRLSVDIDLAYLPLVPREDALAGISGALEQLAVEIEAELPETAVAGQPVAGVDSTAGDGIRDLAHDLPVDWQLGPRLDVDLHGSCHGFLRLSVYVI